MGLLENLNPTASDRLLEQPHSLEVVAGPPVDLSRALSTAADVPRDKNSHWDGLNLQKRE